MFHPPMVVHSINGVCLLCPRFGDGDAVYAHCARVTVTLRTDDVRTAYVTSGIHTTYAEIRRS
eukprot:scaffold15031_cov106-Cylindrotheca_fusiformis.AAC.1